MAFNPAQFPLRRISHHEIGSLTPTPRAPLFANHPRRAQMTARAAGRRMTQTLIERFAPFLGVWRASPGGPGAASAMPCERELRASADGGFVVMTARWGGMATPYEEVAVIRFDAEGRISLSSFTTGGGQSQGQEGDAAGLEAGALVIEARMPAGMARSVYWSAEPGTFDLAVESEAPGGWNRFMQHRYRRVED